MQKQNEFLTDIINETVNGLKGYTKAQLKVMGLVFVVLFLSFMWAGVPWHGFWALVVTLIDAVPLIGSAVVLIPAAIVGYFINPTLSIIFVVTWLILLVLHQVVEPIITGKSVGVKIWEQLGLTILGMVLFGPIGGIIGALAAVVLAAFRRASDNTKRNG